MAKTQLFISIGSNLGNREEYLTKCRKLLNWHVGEIITSSQIYETQAWGDTDQGDFLNQVLKLKTGHSAQALIIELQRIEKYIGKEVIRKYGPRVIDIDVLYYSTDIINDYNLTVPHPNLHERKFVLIPLAEIAPDFVHPVLHKSSIELLGSISDPSRLKVWND